MNPVSLNENRWNRNKRETYPSITREYVSLQFIYSIYIYIYKYIGIIEIEKLKINREIINKMEEKKNYSVMLNMIIKFFLAYSLAI